MSFFRKRPEKYTQERALNDGSVKSRTFDNLNVEENDEKQVQELFSEIKKDIDLGNELLVLFDEKCRATHIPVPEELQNVRAAVKRKDSAEPNGSRISFGLFLTAVKKYEKLNLEYSLMIQDGIDQNPELNAQRISTLKTKVVNGIGEADILLFTSLWLLNFTASKYQEIFTIPTMVQIASSPQSAAIGAAKLVSALAFSAFIEAIYDNLDGSPTITQNTNNPIDPDTLTRVEKLAVEKIAENDYDIIMDYVIRYIYSSNDQKYDSWVSYLAVRQSRNSSIDMYSYYPTYSSKEFLRINISSENEQIESSDFVADRISEDFQRKFEDSLYLKNAFVGSDTDTMYRSISAKNRMVFNTAAQASAYKLTKDQVCCFVRIMTSSGIDKRTLRMIKCLVKMSSKSLSGELFMGFSDKLISKIKALDVGALLVNRINGLLSSMMRKIFEGFILKINDREISEIEAKCAVFSGSLDSLIDGIDDAVATMQKEFSLQNGKLQRSLDNSELSLQTKYQIRMLNDIELMLAAIIDNSLDECVNLEDDVAEQIVDEVIGGFIVPSNQYTIDISDEMREKYFSESKPIRLLKKSATFERRSRITIPAIDKFNSPETSEEVIRNILRTCKVDLTDSQIRQMLKDTDGSSR